jgi:hypothetical protein
MHWRELWIKCGENVLRIYPDGGFINGWKLNKREMKRYYNVDDTTTRDDVPIYLNEKIKIGITIEETED